MKRSRRVQRPDRGLEHVVGADHVHAHRSHRALEHGVDAGDRGAMDDVGRPARELVHGVRVEHVRLVEGEVRMLGERRARERVAMEVVGRDDLVLVDEAARERRADEAGAAGDEDSLALEHAASVSGRYPPSDATPRLDRRAGSCRAGRRERPCDQYVSWVAPVCETHASAAQLPVPGYAGAEA